MAQNAALANSATVGMTGTDLVPITPDDDANLPVIARAIRCLPITGEGGTIRITTIDDEVRDTEIAQGSMVLVGVKRVHATGTTATGLEAVL